MPWKFSDDVEPYAERVVPLLSRDPAAYTIGLSIIDTLRGGHRFGDAPMYFGWLEEDGEVRGAISRTPPYDLLLSVVPDVDALVRALREHGAEVPGVNGEVETVERFAAAWTAGTELQASTWLQLRLFALGELEPPDPPPPGRPRAAAADDFDARDALVRRVQRGARPARADAGGARARGDRGSDAARCGRTRPARRRRSRCARRRSAGVARINCVYTPPEQRGRRFGGAITAACAADALAREAERVVLFTDADNPAPNKVYERIGFRPVADHRVVHFKP